jgi:hypothetical protein
MIEYLLWLWLHTYITSPFMSFYLTLHSLGRMVSLLLVQMFKEIYKLIKRLLWVKSKIK